MFRLMLLKLWRRRKLKFTFLETKSAKMEDVPGDLLVGTGVVELVLPAPVLIKE